MAPAGYAPIGFSEIEAWSRLRGLALSAWEIDALVRMDEARREALASPVKSDKPPSAKELRRIFETIAGKPGKKGRGAAHG